MSSELFRNPNRTRNIYAEKNKPSNIAEVKDAKFPSEA